MSSPVSMMVAARPLMNGFIRVGKSLDTGEDVVQVNVNLAGVVWETHHDMTVTPSP